VESNPSYLSVGEGYAHLNIGNDDGAKDKNVPYHEPIINWIITCFGDDEHTF
jgi:hypothetical protein